MTKPVIAGAPIRVVSMALCRPGAFIAAVVRLAVGAVEIDGCKVVQQDGKDLWVGMPSRRRDDGTYEDIIRITSDSLHTRIKDVVLAEYRARMAARS